MDSSPEVYHEPHQQVKYEPYSPHSSYAHTQHTHTGATSTPVPIPYSDQAGLEVAAQQRQYQYGPFNGQNRTILGITRSTFILAVILAVVVVAAAVGGGVGGSVAVSNAKKYVLSNGFGSSTKS